jgi:hypothetical protein
MGFKICSISRNAALSPLLLIRALLLSLPDACRRRASGVSKAFCAALRNRSRALASRGGCATTAAAAAPSDADRDAVVTAARQLATS